MKAILFLLFSIIIIGGSFAQENSSQSSKKKLKDAIYFQEYLSFSSEKPGLSRVDVFVQVPYKNVQFIKSREGFTAKYSMTASVFDSSKKKLIVEKTWNETINVIDFKMTTSKENYNLSKRSFDLSPGTYFIRTMLQDKDSKQEAFGENVFVLKSFEEKISLSDILLISKTDNTRGKNEIIPNISRNFPSYKDRIKFYVEVNLKDTIGNRKTFEYSVLNSENKIIHKEVEDRNIEPGSTKIFYTLAEFPFDLGTYALNVSVVDTNTTVIAATSKSFYSHWKGLPISVTDIDKAISQTMYIAAPDELSLMQEGETISEKTKRFLEFWKKKDPSPNNDENEIFDEYFRRISFANENFSNYVEGWRSDRGMVYTILGAPNNIDRHPFEYDSKPYDVWEYYELNRSLVFLDNTGFGDYRLITPLTGDLYR
ncbi:MAG: GWxTD domain-containing protein, partial [Ignavibacteria bacterium]|nr:GWxTD domain-containing protein [Ignavibacteria bacterium]